MNSYGSNCYDLECTRKAGWGLPSLCNRKLRTYSGGREPSTSVAYEAQKSHPAPAHVPMWTQQLIISANYLSDSNGSNDDDDDDDDVDDDDDDDDDDDNK